MEKFDVLIIGGGIAGTGLGYELAETRTVALLEMESSLGFHTTGRSAAAFVESYGSRTVRMLVSTSRAFFEHPPEGFDVPLLTPRSLLWVASESELGMLEQLETTVREFVPDAELIDSAEAVRRCPVLDPSWVRKALVEQGASDIDVNAIHQGFIRGMKARGGRIHQSSRVAAMERTGGVWRVTTEAGEIFEAPVVVNAAGAWGDEVAKIAGAKPIGLRPMVRNVFIVDRPALPSGTVFSQLPLVFNVGGHFYFKPEGDSMLCSPADEVPSDPCDIKPQVEQIARAIENINTATTMNIRHVRKSWAGLRTFVADRTPVASYDTELDGFFWLVGQGGYGIETSPALSRCAAAILTGGPLPEDALARGLEPSDLNMNRLADVAEFLSH